jgi:Arc/MetJ family transcription regulator
LDLLRTPSGEVSITADRISLPAGLEVTSITPRAVRVAFERLVDRTVEVRPVVTGTPARGHVVGAVRVVPATLRVRGGERKLASVSAIATHEVSAAGAETAFEESIDLDPPAGIAVDPGVRVRVQVEIDDELVTRKLSAIPVGIRTEGGIDAARWAAAPEAVAVTLTGALLAVEQASRELAVFVRVTPGDARPRVAEVEIAGIPPGVGKKVAPATVRLVAVRPR